MSSRVAILFSFAFAATLATASPETGVRMMHAHGTFDVKVAPQTADNTPAQAAGLARLSLDKRFRGDLEGSSQGEMLASGDGTHSGAYVALEKFTGALQGRSGSFVLMHSAMMNRGTPETWSVVVVVDSGTGQLAGINGRMTIRIEGGKHYYGFGYSLP